MANTISNQLSVYGRVDRVQQVFKFCSSQHASEGSGELMDFSKILPVPKALEIERDFLTEVLAILLYPQEDFLSKNATMSFQRSANILNDGKLSYSFSALKEMMLNIENFGFPTGYHWRIEKWGNGRNAYDSEMLSENSIYFSTAWCDVPEIITELSQLFEDLDFTYSSMNIYNYKQNIYKMRRGEIVYHEQVDLVYYPEERKIRPGRSVIKVDKTNNREEEFNSN
jgi:hypothetical protein